MTSCRQAFAAYIGATNTHHFDRVREFIHPDSTYWFGPVCHERMEDIQVAFERAWSVVAHEVYEVSDCRWLIETDEVAVVTYRYHWNGVVDGLVQTGGGLGTNVLTSFAGRWRVVHEHLTPIAAATGPNPSTLSSGCGPVPHPGRSGNGDSAPAQSTGS